MGKARHNSKSIKGRLVVIKNKPMSKEVDSGVGDLTQEEDLETKEGDQTHSQGSVFSVAKLVTLLGDVWTKRVQAHMEEKGGHKLFMRKR